MSEESYDVFVKRLQEKHPRSFKNVYCSISISEGWYHIIESLCSNIDHHIKWKRDQRARELLRNRAIKRGPEAVLKFVTTKGKNPSEWDMERAEEVMNDGIVEPSKYVKYVEVHQIKEKFGGLRFYYEGGDDQVHGMVRIAESWAAHTCETCGERGKLRHGGWVRTLCDKHEAEYQESRKNRE
jgi:hypothetical protein